MKSPEVIIFYHANCPDGFGGAWAAWKKFGTKAAYIPLKHQTSLPPLLDKEIYFVDIAAEESVFKALVKKNKRVVLIDHHQSTRGLAKFATDALVDNNHSGAILSWNYFHPGKKPPTLLHYIEDGDLWKFKLKSTPEISAALEMESQEFKIWDSLVKKFEFSSFRKEYVNKGKTLLSYKNNIVKNMANRAVMIKFEGRKILSMNSPIFESEIGEALYTKLPPISLVWHYRGPDLKVSLRSPKIDVSKIAEKYGGGGHKAAAGFLIKNAKTFPWEFLSHE